MNGETDLGTLLREMKPVLHPGEYVFCTLDEKAITVHNEALAWFRESEGLSLIATRGQADARGWPYAFVSAWITLTVESPLESVGLTAAVARALADAGISCNVVAAYHHDHIFVPLAVAGRALDVLKGISRASGDKAKSTS
jgi:hypothetical protein